MQTPDQAAIWPIRIELRGSDLSRTTLVGTNLRGANPAIADLHGAGNLPPNARRVVSHDYVIRCNNRMSRIMASNRSASVRPAAPMEVHTRLDGSRHFSTADGIELFFKDIKDKHLGCKWGSPLGMTRRGHLNRVRTYSP